MESNSNGKEHCSSSKFRQLDTLNINGGGNCVYFLFSLQTVDFGGQSEAVRQEINTAVEKDTNSKIKDLIPPG